ncbi:HEAT repeat domain-containing protein [Nitrospirota bacterium]
MKKYLYAVLSAVVLFIATPCFGSETGTSQGQGQLPLHLGILDASNNTGDPSLDWIPKGSLELITYSLAYMDGLVLVPLDEDIVSGRFPILRQLDVFGIRHGLSVSLGRDNDKLSLTIRTRELQTDRDLLVLTIKGSKRHILSRLPEAASRIAASIGYIPEDLALRRARVKASSSPEAWEHYTRAIYGPQAMREEGLKAAITADPDFAEARARLSMLYSQKNESEKAASEINRSLRTKPFLYTALYSMGGLYADKGDREMSDRYLSDIMKINPRNRFLYTGMNIDESRNFMQREDYAFLGPRAALVDLESPVYFEGAFEFLSRFKPYSGTLRKTLKNPNIAIKIMSMKAFEMAGVRAWDPKLWELMQSDNYVLRALTSEAFSKAGGRSGCKDAVKSLMSADGLLPDATDQDRADSLRYALASETALAIGYRCDTSSEPDIRELLKAHDKKTRLMGACLLGILGKGDRTEDIIEAIADKDLFTVATEALLASASEADIGSIYNSLDNTPTASFVPLATIAAFDTDASTSALSAALSHKSSNIRTSAVHALGTSRPVSAARLLLSALSDTDPRVRSAAAQELRHVDIPPDAISRLIELLAENPNVSKPALETLAASGKARAIKPVLDSMGNQNIHPKDRAYAIATLSGAASSDIVPLLSHKESIIRQAALKKISQMNSSTLRDHLRAALSDSDVGVRVAALEIISDSNIRDMAKNASGHIRSTISRERVAALGAAALGGEKETDALARSVVHKDPATRSAAARALGKMQDISTISSLSVALRDEHKAVRIAAAEALGNIRDKKADLTLRTALDDPDYEVRTAALISMVKLGERTSIDTLAEQIAESGYYLEALFKASRELEDRALAIYLLSALSIPAKDVRSSIYGSLSLIESVDDIYRHLAATSDVMAFKELRTGRHFKGDLSTLAEEKREYPRSAGYYLMAMKAQSEGDWPAMRKHAAKSYKYSKAGGHGALAVASLIMKAEAELTLDKPGAAISSLEKAGKGLYSASLQERMELYGDLELSARISLMLGLAYSLKDDKETARSYLREAVSRAKLDRLLYSAGGTQGSVIKEAREALSSIQ